MKEMKEKNYISGYAKVIVLVLALIVLGISSTYAYYTSTITGEADQSQLQAGKLELETDLNTAQAITANDLNLINASDVDTKAKSVTFYVKAADSTNVNGNYDVYLKEISISNNLCSKYFKWKLVKSTDGSETELGKGTFKNDTEVSETVDKDVKSVADIKLNTGTITLSKEEQDTLIFRIWLENDPEVNQISLTEGTFSAKLYVEAAPISSQTSVEG